MILPWLYKENEIGTCFSQTPWNLEKITWPAIDQSNDPWSYHEALIISIILLGNPNFLRMAKTKDRFTLSNAFSISNFIMIPCSFHITLECRASWTIVILSRICLLGTNPPWFSKIRLGRIGFIRFANILVVIF